MTKYRIINKFGREIGRVDSIWEYFILLALTPFVVAIIGGIIWAIANLFSFIFGGF